MEELTNQVSNICFALKKRTIVPYFSYMQSSNGHAFMKKIGPIISTGFFTSQFLHAIFFYSIVAPAILELYTETFFTYFWITIGWLLFIKVTYTYWWVTTSNPGTVQFMSNKIVKDLHPNKFIHLSSDICLLKQYSNVMNGPQSDTL